MEQITPSQSTTPKEGNITPSLYAQYLAERTDVKIAEFNWGFVSYILFSSEMLLEDLFILPEYREADYGKKMYDIIFDIAKKNDKSVVTGSVWLGAKNSEKMLTTFIKKYGFKLLKTEHDKIFVYKEVI